MEEGDIAGGFFVQGLGLALVAKTCHPRPQAFERVNNDPFCLDKPAAGTPRHVCKTFHANILFDFSP